jgi:hypothetical protein
MHCCKKQYARVVPVDSLWQRAIFYDFDNAVKLISEVLDKELEEVTAFGKTTRTVTVRVLR